MKTPERLVRREHLWWLLLCNGVAVGAVLLLSGVSGDVGGWVAGTLMISTITGSVCYGGALTVALLDRWLWRRLKRARPPHGNVWRFFLGMFFLLPGLWLSFRALVWLNPSQSMPDFAEYRQSIFVGIIVSASFFTIELVTSLRRQRDDIARRAALAEAEQLRAQLSALTAQVSPHFLFNALNTIAALIHDRPDDAEEATVALAEVLRGVLGASREETHLLSEEVALCRAYLDIEARRFGDRLTATIDVTPEAARVPISPLLIQPLIENAIKYAVAPRIEGGQVTLEAWRGQKTLWITVTDDGPGMGASSAPGGAGVGLSTCRARLDLRYDGLAEMTLSPPPEGSGTRVTLRLPLEEK